MSFFPYRLNAPASEIRSDLLDLQQQHWVNNHTRAIFLEFAVYNAQASHIKIAFFVKQIFEMK